ncbi:putative actinidain [Helianthus annuus]|nr:putative actinidain [Helianthus annuus]KAJ0618116.1 putative actinidain [Helianthus annuus]KAJ0951020.1 putative actinidain [Helianthus annuus]
MAAIRLKSLPLRLTNFMTKQLRPIIQSKGFNSSGGHTTDEVKAMFEAWMVEHKRVYNTLAEKEKRFQNFKDNLKDIEKHNSTGNSTYRLGLTKFSDMTHEEFGRMYGGRIADP